MRIALVYDCLYPATVGGAERWLRSLATTLADEHEVTYVTRRQWRRGEEPLAGVRCVAVAPGGSLYRRDGRRRLMPPALFGLGVLIHFLRARKSYDAVHCLSYPFASLIAVRLALVGTGARVCCEWLESLSDAYWRSYGPVVGRAGALIQRLCLRLTPEAVVFSRHTEQRMRESGYRGEATLLGGLASSDPARSDGAKPAAPLVLFAGRHVADKRPLLVPDAIVAARRQRADIVAVIAGDGPQRGDVLRRIRQLGLDHVVEAPGFLGPEQLEQLYGRTACVLAPSRRDGYGMVVAEAAARGIPVVVCPGPDNAAVERVVDGVNGRVSAGTDPESVAEAIIDVIERGATMRAAVSDWYREHARELSIEGALARARAFYSTERPSDRLSASSRGVA